MDAKQVWRAALGELQVSLSPANYETWVRDTQLIDVDDQKFKIAVPNGFAKDWLETRYRSLISQTLARIVGYSVQVEFVVGASTEGDPADAQDGRPGEPAVASPRVGTTAQVRLEPTRVGRRASIGSHATILCGVTIGEGALVGAGAVVTHSVSPHAIVAGVPARVIGDARRGSPNC